MASEKNHSTSLALIELVDNLYKHKDISDTMLEMYIDLQKALDSVNHDILLYRLCSSGIGVKYGNGFRATQKL